MAGFSGITWTNGVTAVNQTNMQRYETFIEQLEADTGSVSVTGHTSGTATMYQILQGTYKKLIVDMENYQNTSAQDLVLPVAFTTRSWAIVGETQGAGIQFLLSTVAQSVAVQNTVSPTGVGGGQTPVTSVKQWSWGQVNAGFDTIRIGTGMGSAVNGIIIVEGF